MRQPVIVGIDPGTTTGVAVFSLQGRLLLTESRRNFPRSAIRTFILDHGTPEIIASDMSRLPKNVEKIASSFAARVICPASTLTHKDKRRLVGDFLRHWEKDPPWQNRHEKDALVAGWYAWKRIRRTAEKIGS